MKDCRKDFFKFMRILLGVLLGFLLFVGIVDPFYQYHKPWFGIPVILEDAVYQTPGAAKNLEYTDVIVGTSMTENFHTSWFDEEMGWHTIKLSYSGARTDDLKAVLGSIFSREEPVRHVFMDINDYQLTVPAWTAYGERPAYLYDNNRLNDIFYIFNRDVIAVCWERILDTLQGREDNIDSAYTWENEEYFSRENALNSVKDTRTRLKDSQPVKEPLETKLIVCEENLNNIIPFIEGNPDTEFIIYLPPYSMLYWEQVILRDALEDMLEIYRYAMERLLEYDNVALYYFQNEQEIITDLDNYRDDGHHRPEYNRYIFEHIREGKNRVTEENLEQVILDMYEFARDYDYEVYWE